MLIKITAGKGSSEWGLQGTVILDVPDPVRLLPKNLPFQVVDEKELYVTQDIFTISAVRKVRNLCKKCGDEVKACACK